MGSKTAGCLPAGAVSATTAGLLAALCMKYQVAPTDKPIASSTATTIAMISLSLPLVAGSFTAAAASLFAMPIIRHYSGFHSRTARQEQVLCQKCRRIDLESTTKQMWEDRKSVV